MFKARLTGSGCAPLQAQSIGGTVTNNLTSTGSTQVTALLISDDVNIVTTTAASTGVVLSAVNTAGDYVIVVNYGANALTLYPPVGGKINNGTLNAGVAIAANKSAEILCIDGLNYIAMLSA